MEDMTMKLEDIIALAKAGYKPSDIKELVKLAEEPEEPNESEDPNESKESKDPNESKEPKESKDPKESKEPKESNEPDERDKQIEELQEQIKKLQDSKSREDISGDKHDKESLVDIFRDFIE